MQQYVLLHDHLTTECKVSKKKSPSSLGSSGFSFPINEARETVALNAAKFTKKRERAWILETAKGNNVFLSQLQ